MVRNAKVRLPIWEVADDSIVSEMGDITLVFELFMPEIFSLAAEQYQLSQQTWSKALKILSSNTIIHKQDWYWEDKWEADPEKDTGFLSRSSDRYFHERPWMNHRCYLYITRRPRRRMTSAGRALVQRDLTPQDTLTPVAVEELTAESNQFIHLLTDSGLFNCRRWTTGELVSKGNRVGLIERYCQLITPDHRFPESRDIHFGAGLRIGNNHCLIHSIADAERLPAHCGPVVDHAPYSSDQVHFPIGNAAHLGLFLPYNHIYNQYFIIEEPSVAQKKLETRRQRMQSLSAHSRANALNRDAIDALLNESITEGRQLIKSHANVLSWTSDKNSMGAMSDTVAGAIARMGVSPHLETLGMAELWYAGIPGNAADLPVYETFDILAEHALCLMTQETNHQDGISTYGIRLGDRLTGRPLQVDLSDEPMRRGQVGNRNKMVLGGSGSGKSMFMNHTIQHYLERNAHALIIDIGHSYRGLCELNGGYYFAYTDKSPLRLNPFWMEVGERPDIEKIESLIALLLALWKRRGEMPTRIEQVILSNGLQSYFEKVFSDSSIIVCFNTFYEHFRDEFTLQLTAARVKNKDFDADNFLYVLRPYYKGGEYDFLLNAEEQLDLLNHQLIVFELDTIKDHPVLLPVVTLVVMDVFIAKMRRLKGLRKVIVIEEAWKAIASEDMSGFVKYLFKTVRKFDGEAIVVTQEVDDIVSSPVIRQAILNNTDCKIILDQSKYRNKFDELQQLLGLSEKDKALILSLNQHNDPRHKYKEIFISLGSQWSKVYRVELSLEQYLAFTTEEREKIRVQEYAGKCGDLRQGIITLAAGIRDGSVKWMLTGVLVLSSLMSPQRTQAQFPIAEIIKEAVKKVIVATDLAVQRLQTETIVLQNTQKALENAMQFQQLTDIADWVQHQKDLFEGYYQELWQVKNALVLYHKVKDITEQQVQLVASYRTAWKALRQDPHFSGEELDHMADVYGTLLERSVQAAGQLKTVVTAYLTQMDDGGRLEAIDQLQQHMDQNKRDLIAFTEGNILLSLQRSKDLGDIKFIQTLYNIH